jgi:hypothetical protein
MPGHPAVSRGRPRQHGGSFAKSSRCLDGADGENPPIAALTKAKMPVAMAATGIRFEFGRDQP